MEVFGSSGTRGVVNDSVTPASVVELATAVGAHWHAAGADRIAIGRDTRTSGPALASVAAGTLASGGLDVDRLGVLPTPAVQAYAATESIPAMMITASHNPPAHNGVKLIGPDGLELQIDTLEAIERRLDAKATTDAAWDALGEIRTVETARDRYVDRVVSAVDRDRIASADLTVVIDPGHGAGSATSPEIFRRLGCTVRTVNAQPDGHFPGRDPEPVPDNLSDLRATVDSTDADLGIAHDGDADRAIFVDETGTQIEGDAALAALADAELSAGDSVVTAVSTSRRLGQVADAAGARVEYTPIGSTHIVSRIADLESEGRSVPIAGEGNGGILFPAYGAIRDGAYTAARFCELIADEPASQVVAPYSGSHIVRENVHYDSEAEREAMLEAIASVAEASGATIDRTDGFRLEYDDGWVLARPSGTEPLVRIYAEADTADRATDLVSEFETAIREARDVVA
ncbi:MAG: phosphoglucosamine mutase [Halococcoides sp.]